MTCAKPVLTLRALALGAAVALGAACGGTGPRGTPIPETTFADTLGIDLRRFTALPGGVYVRDSVVGTGRVVVAGDSVSVRYVGSFANGRVFDHNQPPRPPLGVRLATGRVISGWETGLRGMRAGGKRQLIVPPELGYGSEDYLSIPAYSVLVFTVDLISIH